jgi:hypothetical protein
MFVLFYLLVVWVGSGHNLGVQQVCCLFMFLSFIENWFVEIVQSNLFIVINVVSFFIINAGYFFRIARACAKIVVCGLLPVLFIICYLLIYFSL